MTGTPHQDDNTYPDPGAPTETTPLLSPDDHNNDESSPSSPSSSNKSTLLARAETVLDRQTVVVLAVVLVVLVELGVYLQVAPVNALMEDIICRKTYSDIIGPPPRSLLSSDSRCKSPSVQSRLAMLRGWQASLDAIPALLASIPYGMLSDRIGRRPIIFLSLLGYTFNALWTLAVLVVLSAGGPSPRTSGTLPLEAVWVASLFTFIGGGATTMTSMLFTIIADTVPKEDTTSAFLRIGAASLTGEIIASPLSGVLMRWKGPWVPCWVGVAFLGVALGTTALALPETLAVGIGDPLLDGDGDVSDAEEYSGRNGPIGEVLPDDEEDQTRRGFHREIWGKATKTVMEASILAVGNKQIILLLVPIIFTIMGRHVGELTLQYATKRYNWDWSEATFLLSFRSLWTLAFYTLVLPGAGKLCTVTFGMPPLHKDLLIARISGMVLVMGAFMVAFSFTPGILLPSLVFFSLGTAFTFPLRSLLNALVEEHFVGTLNSIIGFLENIGVVVAVPWLSFLLSTGIEMGGAWVGLPFMGAGVMFMVAVGFVMGFRLPPGV